MPILFCDRRLAELPLQVADRATERRLARRPSVCHSPSSSFCYVDQRRGEGGAKHSTNIDGLRSRVFGHVPLAKEDSVEEPLIIL